MASRSRFILSVFFFFIFSALFYDFFLFFAQTLDSISACTESDLNQFESGLDDGPPVADNSNVSRSVLWQVSEGLRKILVYLVCKTINKQLFPMFLCSLFCLKAQKCKIKVYMNWLETYDVSQSRFQCNRVPFIWLDEARMVTIMESGYLLQFFV